MYSVGRGVARSKRRALKWVREAAELGHAEACLQLAYGLYHDYPYAREVGHTELATGDICADLCGGAEPGLSRVKGHGDVPADVMTSVIQWMLRGGHNPLTEIDACRSVAVEGGQYCRNDGCEVVGQLKDFKVCPQCKAARYCGEACQKQDWTTGGHKATCGTFQGKA